jgi:hypothetical protein
VSSPRRGDPHRLLMRAIREKAEQDGIARIVASSSEAWASATFRGARHILSLHLEGDDTGDRPARLADLLGVSEFCLPGHLVADVALTGRSTDAAGTRIDIEALTLEDG